MEEKINVSICIANFNGLDIIDACVESVLIQKNIANIEIIIHDDFSTDSSVNLIKEKYKDIKLIESESNVGFCVANNRMATCAKGEYLLFLNNDAELFSDAVETLLTATQAADVPTIFGLPQYATDTHELIDCGAFIDPFFNAVPNQTLRQAEVAMVAGACLWVPKKIWVELGGFPEWFESIAEDLYLCCRARLAGYSVVALGTSGFYHRVGNSFGGGKVSHNRLSTTFRRRALSERNKLFTMLIIVPNAWLYVCLPFQLMLLLIEGVALALWKWQWRIWSDIYAPLIPSIYHYRTSWKMLRFCAQMQKNISFWRWLLIIRWQPYKLQMLVKYGVPEIR